MEEALNNLKSLADSTIWGRQSVIEVRNLVQDGEVTSQIICEFVMALGFEAEADTWVPISREEARFTLNHVLSYTLAFGTRVLASDQASGLVDQFFSFFGLDVQCWRNCSEFPGGNGWSWSPISSWTFDIGCVLADSARIGMFWILEED